MNLFFYDVDVDYVKFLKESEKNDRGFSRVSDIEYQNERKMAMKTYEDVISGNDDGLKNASYDFKLLEEVAIKYKDKKFLQ